MTEPYLQVLANPTSVSARRVLATHWRASGDPRAELIERQLIDHDGLPVVNGWKILNEIHRLIERHGREWAGRIAELARGFQYELGAVAGIAISGDAFVEHGAEIVKLAPVVHLSVGAPIDAKKLASTPALGQMRTLGITAGPWLDDELARTLAASPYIRKLRAMSLCGGALGEQGLRSLAGTANLPDLVYINVTGNPGVRASRAPVTNFEGRGDFILGYHSGEYVQRAYDAAALSYDVMRLDQWPPLDHEITFTE